MTASYPDAHAQHSRFYHATARWPGYCDPALASQTRPLNHPQQGRFQILTGLFPDNLPIYQASSQYPTHLCGALIRVLYARHHARRRLQRLSQRLYELLPGVLQTTGQAHLRPHSQQSGALLRILIYLWSERRISDLALSPR